MSSGPRGAVSALLQQWREGRAEALDDLLPHVYAELRRIASRQMRGERAGHTLQTTALVHEAYLRLVDKPRAQIHDRSHFFAVAAQAMRRVLLDAARRRRAAKRGSGQQPLAIEAGEVAVADDQLLAVDEALRELQAIDPRQAQVVELRYFGGLTTEEVACVLAVSERTVTREWQAAKLWLRRALKSR